MALDLNQIRAIQHSLNSPSEPETRRRYAKHIVERDYFKSLDVDKFLFFNQQLTDVECFLNVYARKYSHYDGVEQTFTCPIEVNIEAGDIVYNPAQDEYWIISTSNPVDYIYRTGRMILCDTFIKWQDDNGNIWEYPVSDNNTTQYNSGIYQGKHIDYVTSQHRLTTVADVNVCALRIDTRFFLGKVTSVPEVFRLTQIDTTSLGYGKSIAQLTVLRSTYNPDTDDVVTGICRMKEVIDDVPEQHEGDVQINYKGKPQLYIGSSKVVSSELSNCSWDILESEIASQVHITQANDFEIKLELPATNNSIMLAGKTFTLSCTDSNDNVGTQLFTILGGA